MQDGFSPLDKLREAQRELALRKRKYPEWVEAGAMTEFDADRRIQLMEAIVADYAEQVEAARGQTRLGL